MAAANDTCTPIACELTDAELRARRAELRRELASATVEETRELPDGYVIRFTPVPGLLDRLARFIDFESVCCPFLTFTLEVREHHGPVSLSLTGPPGTREFLRGDLQVPNATKGLVPGEDGTSARVSSIFEWFAGDFAGGGGIAAFVEAKAEPALAARIAGLTDSGLSYLAYDWSVNDTARSE